MILYILLDLLYWFVKQQIDVRTTHLYSSEAIQILSYTSINCKVLNIVWRPFFWRQSLKTWRWILKKVAERIWRIFEQGIDVHQNTTWQHLFWPYWRLYKKSMFLRVTDIVHSTVSLSHKMSNINDRVDSDFYQLQHSTCPIK